MGFCIPAVEADDRLDYLVERIKALPYQWAANLGMYGVVIKAYWCESVRRGDIEARPATQVEIVETGYDVIIEILKEAFYDYSDKDLEAVMASELSTIAPRFFGKASTPIITTIDNRYKFSSDIVKYYGKEARYGGEFFEEIDNIDDECPVYSVEKKDILLSPFHRAVDERYESGENEERSPFEEVIRGI